MEEVTVVISHTSVIYVCTSFPALTKPYTAIFSREKCHPCLKRILHDSRAQLEICFEALSMMTALTAMNKAVIFMQARIIIIQLMSFACDNLS